MLLEEGYHTRLLLSATSLFGVRVTEAAQPVAATRAIVAGIAELPEVASRPVTLAGEIIGILTFLRLAGAVRRVFRDHPEVRDALEERVTEVLIDEVGHMSLNRLLAATGTFAALRAVLPLVALGTRGALPEADSLGISRSPSGRRSASTWEPSPRKCGGVHSSPRLTSARVVAIIRTAPGSIAR